MSDVIHATLRALATVRLREPCGGDVNQLIAACDGLPVLPEDAFGMVDALCFIGHPKAPLEALTKVATCAHCRVLLDEALERPVAP